MIAGEVVPIKEAMRRGILDSDLSTYKDLVTGKTYTIQEAIDSGLLIATLEDPSKPKDETGMSTNELQPVVFRAQNNVGTAPRVSVRSTIKVSVISKIKLEKSSRVMQRSGVCMWNLECVT